MKLDTGLLLQRQDHQSQEIGYMETAENIDLFLVSSYLKSDQNVRLRNSIISWSLFYGVTDLGLILALFSCFFLIH